jgi:hypothetical protein
MQELVDENSNLVLQHVGGDGDITVCYIDIQHLLELLTNKNKNRNDTLSILVKFICQNLR